MSKMKILVCCHKPGKFKSDDIYMPIQVGKAMSQCDLGMLGDDTGDNISAENANFCELTALYWSWKNMEPVDYIGLCHYRRYFNFHKRGSLFMDSTIVKTSDFGSLNLDANQIASLFKRYDIIIAKPQVAHYSLSTDYCVCHIGEDLRVLLEIIREKYPDYMNACEDVLLRNNKISAYNMMIMGWDDFDKYCTWLFDILFEARKRINIEDYSAVQRRIWGYMAERLLNVYVYHHKMRVKTYPIYWVTDDVIQKPLYQRILRWLRRMISFKLMQPIGKRRYWQNDIKF